MRHKPDDLKKLKTKAIELYQTLNTPKGARTICLDTVTKKIYSPTAMFEPNVAGTTGRPKSIPGTMKVLVIGSKGQDGQILIDQLSSDPTNEIFGIDLSPSSLHANLINISICSFSLDIKLSLICLLY